MWGHASEAALIDVLDGTAGERVSSHVGSCARCRERLQQARAGLKLASGAHVPEPPPLFWAVFQRQVGRRLAGDSAGRAFGAWPALAALAALLAIASVATLRRGEAPVPQPALPAWSALPPLAEDSALGLLLGLDPAEDDLLVASGAPGVTGLLAGLSDAESRELTLALERELEGRKS